MNSLLFAPLLLAVAALSSAADNPSALAPITPIAPPRDKPYPGVLTLSVDATDVAHHVEHVHESLSGISGETVLLYPQWLPGTHAPEGPIDKFAGLRISANGARVSWTRDPVNVFAFRVHASPGVHTLDIDFDYLSSTSSQVGPIESTHALMMLEWNALVLYPAGYFARQIPVDASVTLPSQWQFGTALEAQAHEAAPVRFARVDLETLVDSPVYAGRYASRVDLDPGAAVAVHMDLFADRPELLELPANGLTAYRALVQQAYKLYGSHHYSHYDFLYSLSDQMQQNGLEHHQSSEDGSDPQSFTEWDKSAWSRDLLPHEFTHSWNGKFRRPFDLWTPNYNVPMQDSLLWVYEGQTQYWGQVLSARSGLWTRQQALDELAHTAAYFQNEQGHLWRALQDTTNDEIINPRRPQSWQDYQRFEDYYELAKLIWLDADTLIRQSSGGKHSLDDFARGFLGVNDGSFGTLTYTFDDVVKALNAVQPYDWASFLRTRLDAIGSAPPLDGLTRGGYHLTYTDSQSEMRKHSDEQRKHVDLLFSIGLDLDDKDQMGMIDQVMWDSPAFKAKLTESDQILAVNGTAYSDTVLKDAIRAAQSSKAPIELIVKSGDRYMVTQLQYDGGLRYPHLERDAALPALLDDILSPRP